MKIFVADSLPRSLLHCVQRSFVTCVCLFSNYQSVEEKHYLSDNEQFAKGETKFTPLISQIKKEKRSRNASFGGCNRVCACEPILLGLSKFNFFNRVVDKNPTQEDLLVHSRNCNPSQPLLLQPKGRETTTSGNIHEVDWLDAAHTPVTPTLQSLRNVLAQLPDLRLGNCWFAHMVA